MQTQERNLIRLESDYQASLANNDSLVQRVQSQTQERERLLANINRYKLAIAHLQNQFLYRAFRRLRLLNSFKSALPVERPAPRPRNLQRVVIDTTPIRPGGENGGMRLAAIELVKSWSTKISPEVEYILLTSSDTHADLAFLDCPNVRRMCVNQVTPSQPAENPGQSEVKIYRSPVRRVTHKIAQFLERILPRQVFRTIYRLYHNRVQTPQSSNLIRSLNADVVFCPFTAVFYHAPEIPTVVVVADLQYIYYPQFFSVEQNYHSDHDFRNVCQVATRLICLSDLAVSRYWLMGKSTQNAW